MKTSDSITANQSYEEAVALLKKASLAYYESDSLVMDDASYDTLMRAVAAIEEQRPEWAAAGVSTSVAGLSGACAFLVVLRSVGVANGHHYAGSWNVVCTMGQASADQSRFDLMGRLRLGVVLSGLVVAAVTFIPSVAGAASAPDGVPGLELCGSLPQSRCYLGPILARFPDYGNVCSEDDCFFVSAADWEKVAAGVTPTLSLLGREYKDAGQTFDGGLSAPDLWAYWKTSGIDDFYLSSETAMSKNSSTIENAVKAHRALIVQGSTSGSSMIGLSKYNAGTEIMIVDGYTSKGPLVVYQAKTIQMTWAQWNAQVRAVWEISVSSTPPTGVTTPPPTSTPNPTATLALSSDSLTSAGGSVTLTYSSENATTCTLTSSPAIWTTTTETVACNGTYVDTVSKSTTAQEWTFTFTATSSSGVSTTQTQTLVELAASSPTPQFDNPNPNWSGYVVPSSSALVTDVSGNWTVPVLNCSDTPNAKTFIWVGVGGEQWATGGNSGDLLQTGTIDDCVDGVQQDSAWWEEVPATPNHETTFMDFPVSPGNEIQASVRETSTGVWQTEVTNVNTGLSAYMVTGESWGVGSTGASTFAVQGSSVNYRYYGAYTAEWIVEDPEEGSATPGSPLYPFANFGSVTFSNMESSFSSWYLTPDEEWGIVQNGVTLAAPTSSSVDGFTDAYTGP
jgi:hypothetical protein